MANTQSAIPVLSLPASDDVPDILEKIRRIPTPQVIIDCRQHPVLRSDPLVRRLLRETAADFGKHVTFHVAERTAHPSALPSGVPSPERKSPPGSQRRRLFPVRFREFSPRPWRQFSRRTPGGRITLTIFATVTGMLLASVVAFVVPRARVHLVLATEPFAADLTLWLDTSVLEPQRTTGTHPVRLLRVEEALEEEFPVQTTVEKGTHAEGTADIVNQTIAPQGIKARTRLQSTSGVVLRTHRDIIIPSQGRASIAVRAEEGGSKGNLEPQRLIMPALPKESQRLLYGELLRPLRGGTDQPVHQLSAGDIERGTTTFRENAERKLLDVLQREARTTSTASPAQEPSVFSRPELSRVVVGKTESSVPVGTETESFRLRATIRGEAFVADASSLRALVTDLLQQRIGAEKDLAREHALDDLRVVDVRWDHGRVELSLHVETPLIPRINTEELRERLRGRTADDAAAFLRAIPGVRSAEVRLSPFWIKRVPSGRRNVQMDIGSLP